jgi:ribonuclease Y
MLNEILIGGGIATVSGVVGFFISKKLISSNFDIYTDQAKAKASAIESEAHVLLQKSSKKSLEMEAEAQKYYESAKDRAKADLHQREDDVIRKEDSFKRYKDNEEKQLHNESVLIKAKLVDLQRNEKSLSLLKKKYEDKIDEAFNKIENCSGMTKEEATKVLLEKV